MDGGIELIELVAILFGVPIVLSLAAAFVLRSRVPRWSRSRKAWTFSLTGPAIELAIAIWFVISGATADCSAESVCDMPGLAVGIGIMLVVAAAVAYPLSAIVTYRLVRDG
jgi:hypothetical protein